MGGVPQPSADFSYLKRPLPRAEVAIHQFGYFLSGARLLDVVQCSLHPFIETGIRVQRLAHLLLSHRKAELINPAEVVTCFAAHSLIGALPNLKMKGSRRSSWDQLDNQSADCLRFMLSGSAVQSVRPFKSIGTLDSPDRGAHNRVMRLETPGSRAVSQYLRRCKFEPHPTQPGFL